MTEPEDDAEDSDVTVTFELLKENYERLWTAAAHTGDTFTDVLNRAVAFYEFLHQAKPGQIVSWQDNDGMTRRVKVLRPRRAQG